MKKIIFLSALCLAAASCGIPKIAMDTSYKGDRITLTSDSRLMRTDDGNMYVALGAKMSAKDTIIGVCVTYDGDAGRGIFDKQDQLLVRLEDGSEFALNNLYDREFENRTETNTSETLKTEYGTVYTYSPYLDAVFLEPVSVTRWVPHVYTTKITNSYALYPISKKQLEGIIRTGVAKMRIESDLGDTDVPRPENLSGLFESMWDCLSTTFKIKKDTTF